MLTPKMAEMLELVVKLDLAGTPATVDEIMASSGKQRPNVGDMLFRLSLRGYLKITARFTVKPVNAPNAIALGACGFSDFTPADEIYAIRDRRKAA